MPTTVDYTDAIQTAIDRETKILGTDTAVQIARTTDGLTVDDTGTVIDHADSKPVLRRLVEHYTDKTGDVSATLIANALADAGATDLDLPEKQTQFFVRFEETWLIGIQSGVDSLPYLFFPGIVTVHPRVNPQDSVAFNAGVQIPAIVPDLKTSILFRRAETIIKRTPYGTYILRYENRNPRLSVKETGNLVIARRELIRIPITPAVHLVLPRTTRKLTGNRTGRIENRSVMIRMRKQNSYPLPLNNILVMKVLTPVDGSDCSYRALEFATGFVTRYDGSLHVIHIADYENEAAQTVIEEAKEVTNTAGLTDDPEIITDLEIIDPRYANRVGKDILEIVENENYDHVIMGHHGTGAVGRLILGSAAETVVRAAETPATVIP